MKIECDEVTVSVPGDIKVSLNRLEVPGGWLVMSLRAGGTPSMAYVPDPDHTWKEKEDSDE